MINVHYHLVLTQKCNLHCNYCGSTEEPTIMPINLDYSLDALKSFLGKDEGVVIAFYGGEPAINQTKIMHIMDEIEAKAFMIQTNGTLLHRIPAEYIARMHSILVSVDGTPEHTDINRGNGVFKRAIEGARYARQSGFDGDLIARMTVTVGTDIYNEVKYLLDHDKPVFNHVHWQLDAMWDTATDEDIGNFKIWMNNIYNPGISKLVDDWIGLMEVKHEIPGIAPFMGIMYTLLNKSEVGLRCRAGTDFFSITTDGRVTFCPIQPSVEFPVLGNIFDNNPKDLINKVQLLSPCDSCDELSICGGRCLYTNLSKYWGDEGFLLVCESVKHLISSLRDIVPRVMRLIDDKIFDTEDFKYPVIENGVEIIP